MNGKTELTQQDMQFLEAILKGVAIKNKGTELTAQDISSMTGLELTKCELAARSDDTKIVLSKEDSNFFAIYGRNRRVCDMDTNKFPRAYDVLSYIYHGFSELP